jgi:hypothetical protein
MAPLPAESPDFGNGEPFNAHRVQGLFDVFERERVDDGLYLFKHLCSSRF